jgi:hypothetical protein
MTQEKKYFICSECGGSSIYWEATTYWDVETQSMEIGETLNDRDPGFCGDCGAENCAVTVQMKEEPKQYEVQVGRDARVYFKAIFTNTLEQLKDSVSRHGFTQEPENGWINDGVDDFENLETINITDLDIDEVIASWSEGDGWVET